MATAKPKILIWDVENSHNLVLSFDLYPEYLSHKNIITERHMFCISYKWYGEKKIHTISILDDPNRFKKNIHDDFYVISQFRKVLEQADAQVFHHGDKFDMPMFNARLAYHKLPPLPKIINIDTKKVASQNFRFNSNRLDYLARFLGYKMGKMDNPEDLWIKCWNGDKKSLKHMEKYNRQDIDILEYVYTRLMPYVKNQKLNMNMFMHGARCANGACGSTNLQRRGTNKTRTNEYQRFQCLDCGAWCDERKALHVIKPERK